MRAASVNPSAESPRGDELRKVGQARQEPADVAHRDGMAEPAEERLVVGRVSDEQRLFGEVLKRGAGLLLGEPPHPGQLVELPEPEIDVDAGDLEVDLLVGQDAADLIDLLRREGRDVLAIIDGDIADAEGLVRRKRCPRDLAEHPFRRAHERLFPFRRVSFRPRRTPLHFPPRAVIGIDERAVLPDDRLDRPHPGDVVAPARGPAGDRHDLHACPGEVPQGGVGGIGEHPVGCQRVVDIGEEILQVSAQGGGQALDGSRPFGCHGGDPRLSERAENQDVPSTTARGPWRAGIRR